MGAALGASADELSDRHAELQAKIAAARGQVDTHTAELTAAGDALEASQQQLAEARTALEATRADLAAAQAMDAELAVRLATEQELLDAARAALQRARDDVAAQKALIVAAAREEYQGRSELAGIAVVLGSKTTQEMQQRLQWSTTIFDTTATRMAELRELEARVADAERRQAAIEAEVAADKARSAENVVRITKLEASAVKQERNVAALVTQHEAYVAAAQAVLDADTRAYEELLATEAQVQGQIAARVAHQLANGAPREDIARLVAMGVVSTDPATYPLADSGAQMILSTRGFIRPVKARPGSAFGLRFHPILKYWRMHNGTDFGAACGVPLYAAQSGTVLQASAQGGFGNNTIIDHGIIDGRSIMTGYAHQSRMVVRAGQTVAMGQLIGYVGTTGLSTGCHLHLQVYRNGTPVNPLEYIP